MVGGGCQYNSTHNDLAITGPTLFHVEGQDERTARDNLSVGGGGGRFEL